MNLVQLKQKNIKEVRDGILAEQHGLCALCKSPITEETGISCDHQHRLKKEEIGEDGAGLIRGVLCRACNVQEGKIWNSMRRYIQPENIQERIEWLESLVEYYKKCNYPLIHPSEKPKEPTVSKRQYNKLKKVYQGRARFPEYPKSGKLTKKLETLFTKYEVSPFL